MRTLRRAIERALGFVPLNLYDEVRRPVEQAFDDLEEAITTAWEHLKLEEPAAAEVFLSEVLSRETVLEMAGNAMKTYDYVYQTQDGCLSDGQVEAETIRDAYRKAKDMLIDRECLRGVTEHG